MPYGLNIWRITGGLGLALLGLAMVGVSLGSVMTVITGVLLLVAGIALLFGV